MARHAEMPQPCFLATFLSPRGVVSSGGVGGFCLLRDPWQGLETFSVVTTWGRVLLAGMGGYHPWVDPRNAAELPTICRLASHNKDLAFPK